MVYLNARYIKMMYQLLYLTILMFGGVGQITTGIFEYIKLRTFPCTLYLIYGLYFLSYFFAKLSGNVIFTDKNTSDILWFLAVLKLSYIYR